MQTEFIKLFNVALSNSVKSETPMDLYVVNEVSLKCGYIVHPSCCTKSVYEYFKAQAWNPNSTFYKTWQEVTSKTRFELFIDQVIHYASTYGTNFTESPCVPNFNGIEVDYKTYTIIQPIDEKGLYEKCLSLIYSGIALQSDLVKTLCDYIINYKDFGLDIDSIKNREAQIYISCNTFIYPSNPESFFKCLVYKATGETMIIKNKELIRKIKCGEFVCFNDLSDDELKNLSKIFYRYKPLFLAFKQQLGWHDSNAYAINKIRKYAKKHHEPMVIGFWESILNTKQPENKIEEEVAKLDNNFKIIKLLQAIIERIFLIRDGGKSMYIIRNGKSYLKNKNYNPDMVHQLCITHDILYTKLINNLKSKACVVKFPKYLNLACPVSEKQFIGNIPYGSFYKMKKHNFIGIYWRNEWGTYDFDLSYLNTTGKIGWNSRYYSKDNDMIYSGDMTSADPEATEILYCEKECPDGLIYVNRFNGDPGSKYKLFFGSQEIESLHRNYMVDPNCIELEEMMESSVGREQLIGYIKDSCVYFMDLTTGNSTVSRDSEYLNILNRKVNTYISLKDVLIYAGFVEYDKNIHNECELDLTDLNKDTLINLFS